MNDKTDIRLVNTHSECDRCTDHLYLLTQELVLPVRAQLAVKSGMISHGLDAIRHQDICQFLSGLAVQCINDAALGLHSLDKADNTFVGLGFLDLRKDLVKEIIPVKGGNENTGVVK